MFRSKSLLKHQLPIQRRRIEVYKVALFARLEANPGTENEVAKLGPIAKALTAKAPELFAKARAFACGSRAKKGSPMTTRLLAALALPLILLFTAMPARASLFSLAASGTISENSSGDSTIPIGTPWSLELTYDT